MKTVGLLATAKKLINSTNEDLPSEYDCRRSISTAYYALFHFFAGHVVDEIAGNATDIIRHRVHRSLDHATTRLCCEKIVADPLADPGIKAFAITFVTQSENRRNADYDFYRDNNQFTKAAAVLAIADVENAFGKFDNACKESKTAFIATAITRERS